MNTPKKWMVHTLPDYEVRHETGTIAQMRPLTDDELELILELTDVKAEPWQFEDITGWKAHVTRRDMHGGSLYFYAISKTKDGAVTSLLLHVKKQPL